MNHIFPFNTCAIIVSTRNSAASGTSLEQLLNLVGVETNMDETITIKKFMLSTGETDFANI